MTKKRNYSLTLLWSLIASISVLLIILSLSYYYLNLDVIKENNKKTIINTGELATDFITSQYINNQAVGLLNLLQVPTEADNTAFIVSHEDTSTTPAYYNIALVQMTISDNLISPYFKWSLLLNNQEIAQGSFKDYDQSGSMIINPQKQELAVGQKDYWVLRIWLENDSLVDQSMLLNGSFKAKVAIDVVAHD